MDELKFISYIPSHNTREDGAKPVMMSWAAEEMNDIKITFKFPKGLTKSIPTKNCETMVRRKLPELNIPVIGKIVTNSYIGIL